MKMEKPSAPTQAVGLLLGALLGSGAAVAADSAHAPAATATKAALPAASFAIRQVRVFDGERVLPSATVLVRDGLIAEVGAGLAVPAGVPVVDGNGATVLPGLIDSHVHSWGEARSDALRFGVTTELDMFSDHRGLAAARAERESRGKTGKADLWSAGTLVTAKGGHGTQYGMPIATLDDPAQAQAFVDARIAEGSDYIKLVLEPLLDPSGKARMNTLSEASLRAAIKAAHARKRLAVVHVSQASDAALAIDAGADGLVHINGDLIDDPKLVAAIKQRNAFVVPTLTVMSSVYGIEGSARKRVAGDARLTPYLRAQQKDQLAASFPSGFLTEAKFKNSLENVRRLHEAGVTLLAGTDSGNPGTTHGASEHGELELLVQAGLSPVQALTAATAAPARSFGLDDRGRIASGLRADLILVDGDPTTDITATRAIRSIWKNGYPVDRAIDTALPTLKPGKVALFDGDKPSTSWVASDDRYIGGKSKSRLEAVADGGKASTLAARGDVVASIAQPWGGLMFVPGPVPLASVDARAVRELNLRVRGDGRKLTVMVFSGTDMLRPPGIQQLAVGTQWQEVRVPLTTMAGVDLANLRGIVLGAGGEPGPFAFEIEAVELR
ncbi:CIA30 family protein [Lysobacter antibioticus]|uniref:CIA30 family protein n=1 Tax=Lysobacter antibioticus TaxID=84531 RepID=UPI000A6A195F|nr:CIA30 family protein [Lysobacter antibioticus]